MESKNVLRQKAKYIRKTLPIEEKSFFVVTKIRELIEYKSAQNVMIYYPMRYELNLLALLNDTKNFYLPRVCGENLQICPFKKGDKLIKSNLVFLQALISLLPFFVRINPLSFGAIRFSGRQCFLIFLMSLLEISIT